MGKTIFIRDSHKANYTVMSNQFLKEVDLSIEAKGLFAYILSLPDDWIIYKENLQRTLKMGRKKFNATWKQLEKSGYVKSKQTKNGTKFDGLEIIIIEKPEINSCTSEATFPCVEKVAAESRPTEECLTENRLTENRQVLSTNKQSTNELNTKVLSTNKQTASQGDDATSTIFKNKIKSLFSGAYPFDKYLEINFYRHNLIQPIVEKNNVERYLDFVYRKTKESKPRWFPPFFQKLLFSEDIIASYIQLMKERAVYENFDYSIDRWAKTRG